MLLPDAANRYGDILTVLRSGRYGTCMEQVNYRIAKDGAMIHRTLDALDLQFYFRSLAPDIYERPYAILRRLPK